MFYCPYAVADGNNDIQISEDTRLVNDVTYVAGPSYTLQKVKQVNASHTRYRALDPELIPVYRQSARR